MTTVTCSEASPAPAPAPVSVKRTRRGGGSAIFVATGILLSRIAGLVRDRVFAHYFGHSDAAGAFRAALRIPNILQNLFGEGVLSASFIPVYSNLIAQGDEETAGRVAGVVATLLACSVSAMVLLGVLLTPLFVDLVAPGFHGPVRALTIRLVQVLFPGVGLLVISAWCLGILNSHRKFFISYVAPVFWNVAMIGTLVIFGARYTHHDLSIALAWGSVVGSGLQLGMQLPFVFRYGGRIRFGLDTALRPVREVFRNLGPVLLSRGVVQLSAYIDGMIASFLGAGAVASLAYAQTIYLLPIGLFGMSVAAAELPEMSSSVGALEDVHARLRARLEGGKRNIAFFVVPSVIGFLFMGRNIVSAIYRTGQFGAGDTLFVWYILIGSTVGLLAATWGRLYSSAFYALRDTRTPLRFAVIRVILTAVLGVIFAFPLRPWIPRFFTTILRLPIPSIPGIELALGAVGLTASAGIAGWIEFLMLRQAMARRIGKVVVPGVFQAQVWGAAVLAGIGALSAGRLGLGRITRAPRFHYDFGPVLLIGIFCVLYFIGTGMMGLPEAHRVLKRLIRRR